MLDNLHKDAASILVGRGLITEDAALEKDIGRLVRYRRGLKDTRAPAQKNTFKIIGVQLDYFGQKCYRVVDTTYDDTFGRVMQVKDAVFIGHPRKKESTMMKATGILSWPAEERRSDRYGMISLFEKDYNSTVTVKVNLDEILLGTMAGKQIKITAKVLEARESDHIGDLFRGLFPSTPRVGQVFSLGQGALVVEELEGRPLFGLKPTDNRDTDWFDPKKLYQLHDQTVELTLEEVA